MQLLPLYKSQIELCLTQTQIQTLKILIWLLTVQKTVKIERLSACFPLPIRYESRRKHLQRFLTLSALSLPLFGFPIINKSIKNSGHQKYIARLTEARRTSRRHSNFWLGIYGELWIIAWEFLINVVRDMMSLTREKLPNYHRGIRAMNLIKIS